MSTSQAMRDGETARTNPPYVLITDERCQSDLDGQHDLDEADNYLWRIPSDNRRDPDRLLVYCAGCTRSKLVSYYKYCRDQDLAEPEFDYQPAERCDQCHWWVCRCGEDD